jgi:hypothetical protein
MLEWAMRSFGTRTIGIAILSAAALAGCGNPSGRAADDTENGAAASSTPPPFNGGRANRFVNSRENARSDRLRRYYTDFSFNFPSHWMITRQPTDGTAVNYVRVTAYPVDGYEPFSVNVGSVSGTGDGEADRRELERQLPEAARRLGATIPNYRITYMGPQRVGLYPSIGWRWEANAPGTNGSRPTKIYGRNDMVLLPGATAGISISTFVTDRTPEAAGQAQTGESPTIAAIFDSLRIGPPDSER